MKAPWFRIFGSLALWFCLATAFGLVDASLVNRRRHSSQRVIGMVIADYLACPSRFGRRAIITAAAGIVALYFATTFEVALSRDCSAAPSPNSASDIRLENGTR